MESNESLLLEKHIFIHSLLGRTGSTALQRIINSSNEACIWGEPWGLFDKILQTRQYLIDQREKLKTTQQQDQYIKMAECFYTGKHDIFYPNAFRSLDDFIAGYDKLICDLLRPMNSIKRFGYKNITRFKSPYLELLSSIFPNALLIFLIRKPDEQWASIKASGFFNFELDLFISNYTQLGKEILAAHTKYDHSIIIDKSWLFDSAVVQKLFSYLSLSSFDKDLIGKTISSFATAQLDIHEHLKLENSGVYSVYDQLLQLSKLDKKNIIKS